MSSGSGTGCSCCPRAAPVDLNLLTQSCAARGPDRANSCQVALSGGATVEMFGYVLHLRGETPTVQPTVDRCCGCNSNPGSSEVPSCFLWNGEVFGGVSIEVRDEESDTSVVFNFLLQAERSCASFEEFSVACRNFLEGVFGPFAFIYFSGKFQAVLFGRDPIGRRSLVMHTSSICSDTAEGGGEVTTTLSSVCGAEVGTNGMLLVPGSAVAATTTTTTITTTSGKRERGTDDQEEEKGVGACEREAVGVEDDDNSIQTSWTEVPIGGIFAVNLAPTISKDGVGGVAALIPWIRPHQHHPLLQKHDMYPRHALKYTSQQQIDFVESDSRLDRVIAQVAYQNSVGDSDLTATKQYLHALSRSVFRRVSPATRALEGPQRPVMVLFSGGIDSTMLAALAHIQLDIATPIELVSVAFGDFPHQTPDRLSAYSALRELRALPNGDRRQWHFIEVDVSEQMLLAHQQRILNLIYPLQTVMDLNIGSALWFAARGEGNEVPMSFFDLFRPPRNKLVRIIKEDDPNRQEGGDREEGEGCPCDEGSKFGPLIDALVQEGLDSNGPEGGNIALATLGKDHASVLTPHWRGLGYAKLKDYAKDAAREGIVAMGTLRGDKQKGSSVRLIREADIAKAVAFSSGATCDNKTRTRCLSKIVILGAGADETLGGYVRYQRTFQRDGAQLALGREMQLDFQRLWQRNLGRDDRIVSDSGREGRFPFLDEEVLATLGNTRREDVCDFSLPAGVGDKRVLRTAARLIGLTNVSRLQKRAIQFGTRAANRKLQGNVLLQRTPLDSLRNPFTSSSMPPPPPPPPPVGPPS